MTAEHLLIEHSAQIDLCDRVKQFLDLQHFSSMRKLEVTAFGDTVVLDGCTPSFHERQMAVTFCKRVAGVRNVIDRLIVTENPPVAGRVLRARLDSVADDPSLLAINRQRDAVMARRWPR